MDSISFDFAADFYDATRGFPPGVGAEIADSLLSKLENRSPILEVGVGTGRVLLPLMEQGERLPDFSIFGVDISLRMLSRLRSNIHPGMLAPPLVLGDARYLPFPAGQFDAVLMVHLIHLILDWQSALVESRRVLGSKGTLFIGIELSDPASAGALLRKMLHQIMEEYYPDPQFGLTNFSEKTGWLTNTGATIDSWEAASWTKHVNVGDTIRQYEDGTFSSTWRLPVEARTRVINRLREWAVAEFGTLEAEFEVPRRFIWERYRWID
jgi:ubiquinone/menaquinone biosynthesis C-methylase UbiE